MKKTMRRWTVPTADSGLDRGVRFEHGRSYKTFTES
jgi:hypothetical protein